MKKILSLIAIFFVISTSAISAEFQVFSTDGYFGLKDSSGNVLIEPEYKKMITVGNNESWIVLKKGRYGLIDKNGMILVPIKYTHAERVLGRFAKLGNDTDYGLYGADGRIILPPMYSSIDLLYGNMFLTCRKYKYGVVDFEGNILLANDFDDIYIQVR